MRATLPLRARSMLPWALDRLVPDAAARVALPSAAGHFAWRPEPRWRPPTRTSREGRDVSALSGSRDPCRVLPRREDRSGSPWLRHLPKEAPRPHSTMGPEGLMECQWIHPERRFHRVGPVTRRRRVSDVIATHLRRDSFATQRSLRRAATGGSSSCSPILPRSPAYVMVRPLAADTHARRRARLRATRAHPEGCCVEPKGEIPKNRVVWASRRPTRRCALGGS